MAARRCAPGTRSPRPPRSPRRSRRIASATAATPRPRRSRYAIIQAEDELASIGMVIGAAWNGARAFTATSGPGISLMQEFIGLAYFAEIPAVIFDIQRGSPSTGMPTRTQQADILSCRLCLARRHQARAAVPAGPERELHLRRRRARSRRPAADPGLRHARPRHRHERLAGASRSPGTPARQLRPRQGHDLRDARSRRASSAAISMSTATASPTAPIPARTRRAAPFSPAARPRTATPAIPRKAADYVDNMQRLLRKFETAKRLVPRPVKREAQGADQLRRDLFRLDRAGDGTRRSRRSKSAASISTRCASAPSRSTTTCSISSATTSASLSSSRTATRRCARLLTTEGEIDPARLVPILHYDGTPITARFIVKAIADMLSVVTLAPLNKALP